MFQNSLFMCHTQCSMQYGPSLIPTTRVTRLPPTSPPKPSVYFSQSTVSHGLSPPPISPNSLLLSISPCPLCYSLCSTNKRNHMIIGSLCLTYFTQHNLFQSRPYYYKSWVFILSDEGIILHCIYYDQNFIHSSVEGHLGSFHY